ncbi:P2X purinoceptor 7-like [Amblyomma americanum]
MTEKEDCLCCQEVPEITGKQKRARCITTTKKFKDVCLNKAVLEVALARQESRASRNDRGSVNKRMRYAAYRQFVYLVWKRLGRHKREILPSCVLSAVRKKYLSADGSYTGFKHPYTC